MITIQVNGKKVIIEHDISLARFLSKKEIKKESVVVLVNEEIIKKNIFDTVLLKDNDKVEILRFVSGG